MIRRVKRAGRTLAIFAPGAGAAGLARTLARIAAEVRPGVEVSVYRGRSRRPVLTYLAKPGEHVALVKAR